MIYDSKSTKKTHKQTVTHITYLYTKLLKRAYIKLPYIHFKKNIVRVKAQGEQRGRGYRTRQSLLVWRQRPCKV